MNKILTIIIPTYNMEKLLRRCLDSLVIDEEGMKLLEVLVINDGSKDSSSQIAHEYQDRYPDTYRVIDKENGNYGSCINRGLKEATGKYVKVLDADDYFNTKQFAQYITRLLQTNADLVLTDFDIVDEVDSCRKYVSYNIPTNHVLKFVQVCKNKSFQNLSMHAVTYKSDIFSRMNYYQSEGISYTDQEWIFSPMSMVEDCIYYPILVYQYLLGRQGQTMESSTLLKNISHTMQGTLKMCDEYGKMEIHHRKRDYFEFQLHKRCAYIYRNYLISHPTLNINELIVFDKLLQNTLQVYDFTNHIVLSPYLPFHYVRRWRTDKYLINQRYFGIIRFFIGLLGKISI